MARNFTVPTGDVEYTINGVKVRYNFTDMVFLTDLSYVADKLESLQNKYGAVRETKQGIAARKEYVAINADAKAAIDKILGDGTAQAIYGERSICSLHDGVPLWVYLLDKIYYDIVQHAPEIETATSARMQEIMAKYDIPDGDAKS